MVRYPNSRVGMYIYKNKEKREYFSDCVCMQEKKKKEGIRISVITKFVYSCSKIREKGTSLEIDFTQLREKTSRCFRYRGLNLKKSNSNL